ncbi:MAG: hypothetical protein E4G98_03155 [Promethearchaeota archaeon]|nr:MAG: hypothetical protein E4G98_03155 [Candidatus Lokiarchaeota archaeon]
MVQVMLSYNKKYAGELGKYLKMMEYTLQDIVLFPENEKPLLLKQDPDVIRNVMVSKLKAVDALIYLAGDEPPDDIFIDYQINSALTSNIPVVPVRIPSTRGVLPECLAQRKPIKMQSMNVKLDLWEQLKRYYS